MAPSQVSSPSRIFRGELGLCFCTNHFRLPEVATSLECSRWNKLRVLCDRPKFDVDDLARALHSVHQGKWTMQSMVFEPSTLRIHVAMGPGPITIRPMKSVELGPLLR